VPALTGDLDDASPQTSGVESPCRSQRGTKPGELAHRERSAKCSRLCSKDRRPMGRLCREDQIGRIDKLAGDALGGMSACIPTQLTQHEC
jgi:hypothetical protein